MFIDHRRELYGAPVLHLDSDISLSSDPVISFGFLRPKGQLKVLVGARHEGFELRAELRCAAPTGSRFASIPLHARDVLLCPCCQ